MILSQREWLAIFLGAFLAIAEALGMGSRLGTAIDPDGGRGATTVDPDGAVWKDGGTVGTNSGCTIDPDGAHCPNNGG